MVRADSALNGVISFQVFVDNFVHADLHPGNILVQGADGLSLSREAQLQQVDVCDTLVVAMVPALCPLRLVLLDAGIVAELQAADLRNFRAVFLAVAMGQVRSAAVGSSRLWDLSDSCLSLVPGSSTHSFSSGPVFAKGAAARPSGVGRSR